jgi:hypothetical protein
MGKIIKHTNLSAEEPGPRADVDGLPSERRGWDLPGSWLGDAWDDDMTSPSLEDLQ